MAKMGQSLPATLPPGLVPPSMQRLRRSSETPAATQLPCNCTHNCPCLNDFLCLSVCLSVILCPYWEISGTSQNNHQSVFNCLYQHRCRYSVCICWSRPCAYTNGWTDLSAFWGVELSGPKEPCVGWVLNFPPPKQRKRHFYGNIHGCAVCPGFPIVKYSRCFRLPLFRKQTEPLHGGGQNNFPLITIMFCV